MMENKFTKVNKNVIVFDEFFNLEILALVVESNKDRVEDDIENEEIYVEV